MKKFMFILLFVFLFSLFVPLWIDVNKCLASQGNINFCYEDKKWSYTTSELIGEVSSQKNKLLMNFSVKNSLEKLYNMGFDKKTSILYMFENMERVLEQIAGEVDMSAINSEIQFKNGIPYATKEAEGRSILTEGLYTEIYDCLLAGKNVIQINPKRLLPDITHDENSLFINKRGSFSTPIYGVNQEGRIHNIKTALDKFNEMKVEPGDTISFNKIIGLTTEENGYKKAKVIINGKYEDDFGGGVCQAATTLYNALLISNLSVHEVNPHSLKVGYVASSFDAMVANGISDLVFENNTTGPIFITSYCSDSECGVSIFGLQNEYQIERISENVDFDKEENPNINLKSTGYLHYYKNGELVQEKKIRNDKYYMPKVPS